MAVVQANVVPEDQFQVESFNSSVGTFIGVYGGHVVVHASCYIDDNIFNRFRIPIDCKIRHRNTATSCAQSLRTEPAPHILPLYKLLEGIGRESTISSFFSHTIIEVSKLCHSSVISMPQYSITWGSEAAMQMSRKYTLKNVLLGKDTFVVTIDPNVDSAFIVSLIVILDEIQRHKQRSAS